LLVENLSQGRVISHHQGSDIGVGEQRQLPLPLSFTIGETTIAIELVVMEQAEPEQAEPERPALAAPPVAEAPLEQASPEAAAAAPGTPPEAGQLVSIEEPTSMQPPMRTLRELGETPDAETLARWFETLIMVQQAAASSAEFLDTTARAVVELVGLDVGLVLLREADAWRVAAEAARDEGTHTFSTTVLAEVVQQRRTFYRNLGADPGAASLVGVETVVAAPIVDAEMEVIGAVYGSRALRHGLASPDITPLEARVVQVLAAAAAAGLAREHEREEAMRLQIQFEQFFTTGLARELVADPSLLEGRDREVSLLFSDVHNFSRISEQLGAVATFEMMQDLMEMQTRHVRDTDGVLVDYVGDGLLAMWNAPADVPGHAWNACIAAHRILAELPAVSARWEAKAGEPLGLGIGINTGNAIVGNTGSSLKFQYGPMGMSVNLASRVQNATKSLGMPLLVTRMTRLQLPPETNSRRIGGLRVQGLSQPVDVFELGPEYPSPEWTERRDRFERALMQFEQRQWPDACREFAALVAGGLEYDIPTLQLLSRSVECMRSNPAEFDPALVVEKLP
jgi:adenylate cyclase